MVKGIATISGKDKIQVIRFWDNRNGCNNNTGIECVNYLFKKPLTNELAKFFESFLQNADYCTNITFKQMKNIYYIAEHDFEKPDASTARIINNAKALLINSGNNIRIIGYGNLLELEIENIKIINLPKGTSNLKKFIHYFFRSIHLIRCIHKLSIKPDVVIYYGSSTRYLIPLLLLKKRLNFVLISDIVEWYDYASLPMGKYGLLAIDTHIAMTKLIPKSDGIIVISSFLENYYKSYNQNILKIPVILDTKYPMIKNRDISFDHDYLNLIYAGTPGEKDIIKIVIEAVNKLNKEGYKVKFHILGCECNIIEDQCIELSDNIIFYGRLPQNVVYYYLMEADFSVLLRPNNRKSNAGFPTKFVESLNAGLPVIANLTSDLGLYLKDGYNGFVLENFDLTTLTEKIKYILSFPKSVFNTMRENAKNTAKQYFDYRNFSNELSNFIFNLINEDHNNLH